VEALPIPIVGLGFDKHLHTAQADRCGWLGVHASDDERKHQHDTDPIVTAQG